MVDVKLLLLLKMVDLISIAKLNLVFRCVIRFPSFNCLSRLEMSIVGAILCLIYMLKKNMRVLFSGNQRCILAAKFRFNTGD